MVTKFLSFDQFCHFFDQTKYDFKYQKRIELIKTIRLSTHIDIFDEKKFSKLFFGIGGQKVNFFF